MKYLMVIFDHQFIRGAAGMDCSHFLSLEFRLVLPSDLM